MNESRNRLVLAITLFCLDKVLFCIALVLAKYLTPVEISWWVATAPLWMGLVLFWPLGRLTEEVLFFLENRHDKKQEKKAAKARSHKLVSLASHYG